MVNDRHYSIYSKWMGVSGNLKIPSWFSLKTALTLSEGYARNCKIVSRPDELVERFHSPNVRSRVDQPRDVQSVKVN